MRVTNRLCDRARCAVASADGPGPHADRDDADASAFNRVERFSDFAARCSGECRNGVTTARPEPTPGSCGAPVIDGGVRFSAGR